MCIYLSSNEAESIREGAEDQLSPEMSYHSHITLLCGLAEKGNKKEDKKENRERLHTSRVSQRSAGVALGIQTGGRRSVAGMTEG